jgi:hypothetical protein
VGLPLVYTTCDRGYFDAHGETFRRSAEAHGHQVRVDIVEDTDPDFYLFEEPRTFYCFARWLRLPALLKEHPAVLMVDIDSIFNAPAEVPENYDIGLFLRPWLSPLALKVLCAASYWTDRALQFAETVKENILHRGFTAWGNDQYLVWQHYFNTLGQYQVLELNDNFLNYNFNKEAVIWTAKGPSRKSNAIYLERRARYAA